MDTSVLNLDRQWDEQGYIVIRGLVEPGRVDRLRRICERVLQEWYTRAPETGLPGDPTCNSLRDMIQPAYHPGDRSDLLELLEYGADPDLLAVVRASTGFEPLFRAASLFFNPKSNSKEGNWHRDCQYMTDDEAVEKEIVFSRNYCMALQLALVPSEDLQYIPGSHLRWDTPAEYQIRKGDGGVNVGSAAMPGAQRFSLQPGDAVALNPMGLHRGRYHTDKLRRTLMITYTSTEKYWRDKLIRVQPHFLDPEYLEGLSPRARKFYQRFVDTFAQEWAVSESAAH